MEYLGKQPKRCYQIYKLNQSIVQCRDSQPTASQSFRWRWLEQQGQNHRLFQGWPQAKTLKTKKVVSLEDPSDQLWQIQKGRSPVCIVDVWCEQIQSKNSKKKRWGNCTARVSILVGPDEEKAYALYKGCLDITQHHSDCLNWNT